MYLTILTKELPIKFFYKVAKVVRKACKGGVTRIRCQPEAAAEGSTAFW
jgi:hypothetical protein